MECPKLLLFNPFIPNVPFLYSLKISENMTFALGTNRLIKGDDSIKTKEAGHGAGKYSKACQRKI